MTYISEVLADSPKAFWEEQDASGNPADSSGNGLNMTGIAGTVSYHSAGPLGSDFSILTHGSADLERSSAVSTVTDNFTMEMWLFVEIIAGTHSLAFSNGDSGSTGWGIDLTPVGSLSGGTFPQYTFHYQRNGLGWGAESTIVLNINTWHLIVILRRSGTWEYWVDGVQDSTAPGSAAPNTPTSKTQIAGGSAVQLHTAYTAVYETALSGARIAAHYAAATAIQYSDSATITSVTTPSGSENTSFIETKTITSVTTPSASEIYTSLGINYTDSAIISSKSVPSALEERDKYDVATITNKTTFVSNEHGPFTDSDTLAIITQITTGEYDYVHPTGYWGPFDTDDGII